MNNLETITVDEITQLFVDEYFEISKVYNGKEQEIKELKGMYYLDEDRIKIFPRNCESLDDELITLLHEFVHYRDDYFGLKRTEEEIEMIALYMFCNCRDVLGYIVDLWQYKPYKRQTHENSYT